VSDDPARGNRRSRTEARSRSDAGAAGLRYVDPNGPGIRRIRAGRGFRYLDADHRPIRSKAELARIRSLAVPPAWTDVWICPSPSGHLQAVGRDARGRRQYRYHAGFRARRDRDKFARLAGFGAALPRLRRRVRRDLARRGLPREKVLAAVVGLLDSTQLRVGNDEYARINRSFGVSTLRKRHATVSGETLRLRFRGKGGRTEDGTVVDRRLATVVRRCQELPGQALFEYLDPDGQLEPISSEDVNDYIRAAMGSDDYTAKDFRAWGATVIAHLALRSTAPPAAGQRRTDPVREAIRATAEQLNDSPAITRSAYVHPAVLDAYDPGATRRPPVRRARRAQPDAPVDRADELAVLEILRRAATTGRRRASRPSAARPPAATRPERRAQLARRSRAGRSDRSAA
jgi:DNA topoisomerase-1